MRRIRTSLTFAGWLAFAVLAALVPGAVRADGDSLFVGDSGFSLVARLDIPTGKFGGVFVPSGAGGLNFPTGMVFDHRGNLIVDSQNAGLPIPGEILRFDGKTGAYLGTLVSIADPNAPWSPRGIVLDANNVLYVADMDGDASQAMGQVRRYDAATGAFLGNLDASQLGMMGYLGDYHPRSVVFGPDGLLYVSIRNFPSALGGAILRFDTHTGSLVDVFAVGDSINRLNRPEGLVFGPDGNLYVASYRADSSDNDRILIFAGPLSAKPGKYLDKIDLAKPEDASGKRAFAAAVLFGPEGLLYVPITGSDPDVTGSVRRYVVQGKAHPYTMLNKTMRFSSPAYLTFRRTNPATLRY